jgi:hypothetical protein
MHKRRPSPQPSPRRREGSEDINPALRDIRCAGPLFLQCEIFPR